MVLHYECFWKKKKQKTPIIIMDLLRTSEPHYQHLIQWIEKHANFGNAKHFGKAANFAETKHFGRAEQSILAEMLLC